MSGEKPSPLSERPYEHYVQREMEWPGLDKRLGRPRVVNHFFFAELQRRLEQKEYAPDDFSYFEVGCGHGNDLRAVRKVMDEKGYAQSRVLGVDFSEAEIKRGLEFYHQRDNEDTAQARQWFAQGDLRDLRMCQAWDEQEQHYAQPLAIGDEEFSVLHMEAVLHGFGHGVEKYADKKASTQRALNELFRICKKGGTFFGRASVFEQGMTADERDQRLADFKEWRFRPEADEFREMLKQAGFQEVEIQIAPHPKMGTEPKKEKMYRLSFVVEKPAE